MNTCCALLLTVVVSCLVARGASVYVVPGGALVVIHPGHVVVFDPQARQTTVPCGCNQGSCSCCAPVNIPQINVNQKGCLNTKYDSENLAISINFKFGDTVIFEQKLSASNPPPICYPIPQLPMVTVCLRLYNIKLVEGGIYTCIKVEFQILGTPVLVLNFDCVQITNTGIVPSKPVSAHSSPPVIDVSHVWYTLYKPQNLPTSTSIINNHSSDDDYDVINETKIVGRPTLFPSAQNSSTTLTGIEGAVNTHSNNIGTSSVLSIEVLDAGGNKTAVTSTTTQQAVEGMELGKLDDFTKLGENDRQ